jgi:DNA-binding NarL/FixJ family response regulator
VDDHDLFRTGLRSLLEEQGVQVAGECDNGTDALRAVRELAPDVVVMDLNMPGISGVEATRQISMIAPLTRVLVLTIPTRTGWMRSSPAPAVTCSRTRRSPS